MKWFSPLKKTKRRITIRGFRSKPEPEFPSQLATSAVCTTVSARPTPAGNITGNTPRNTRIWGESISNAPNKVMSRNRHECRVISLKFNVRALTQKTNYPPRQRKPHPRQKALVRRDAYSSEPMSHCCRRAVA